MNKTARSALALTVFAAIALVCALIVVTALRNPVEGAESTYTATFSDVSGLYVGDDVRISGVQVGKVKTIRLNGRNADVEFTVVASQPVYSETVAAVRYQNLVGQRYLELAQPDAPGALLPAGSTIPIGSTIPSFDVAKLFNGFRPIFRTLDPAEFNQLGENLLRLIQGDESGIGPVLRDLDEVSKFAADRQAVFITLIRNLGEISVDLGGKSKQLFDLITTLNGVLIRLTAKAEGFRQGIDEAVPTLRNVIQILQYTERTFDGMTVPFYDLTARMFPQTPTIIAGLSLVPSLIQGLRNQLIEDRPAVPRFTCSNGEVTLPGIGIVSFAEQNLVVCR
ncbi:MULTISPECIES: MlaD family protein [unclassified Mycobacterium]|uniref:MlaD family protein n=1 Tax=unclassified Mycobacterium TaxID=2642494 RepID=UPI00073FF8BF|nr:MULTISPECIES: MlaD family protein [unclassified Mycobacterium]KUH81991.1 mammalian cell entry protein [Mycobacterium sp. IS-1556]KUH82372.1 mammalian cell entry protein [Mycobacterium sp. GA-0227b]KUH88953.1 mammalian cell entry protein [Mycobacterium sp. GA-1999]KUH97236.1 mammalian cell entry protein [Mycobacterium sp. IS-3022]KUH97448.1 mammalian cell entry protein [Mycobacterium sp. IS-3022]